MCMNDIMCINLNYVPKLELCAFIRIMSMNLIYVHKLELCA